MTQGETLTIFKDALWLILKLSAPILIVSILIGLIISIFQAATQIHEQTLTFVPKVVAILGLILVLLPWLVRTMVEFTTAVIQRMPDMVH